MHALKKDKYIYIPIPKNGVMTFNGILERDGWEWFNFYENDLDYHNYTLWGHLTEPNLRHTRGVEQYLRNNPDIDLDNPMIQRLLVSGVFDHHAYSVHMILGHIIDYPILWIPLDAKITDWNGGGHRVLDGNDLTNEFFKEHNLDITVNKTDIRNITPPDRKLVQDRIKQLKQQYEENYNCLVGNFLDTDIILYNRVVKEFQIKYGSTE